MTKKELKERFKKYAINVASFALTLPDDAVNRNYKSQLARCVTSSAANYSASLRAKSKKDFINKFKIVEEELDETLFFLELILAINPKTEQNFRIYTKEGNELLSIMVASLKTLRKGGRGGNRKS